MDGVPLAQRREPLKCGIRAVDLRSGRVIAFLEFQTAVEEIFDVQLLPGLRFPEVLGFQKEASGHTIWIDQNAAGWGWFVDATPGDDSEFTTPGNQGEQRRIDLLRPRTRAGPLARLRACQRGGQGRNIGHRDLASTRMSSTTDDLARLLWRRLGRRKQKVARAVSARLWSRSPATAPRPTRRRLRRLRRCEPSGRTRRSFGGTGLAVVLCTGAALRRPSVWSVMRRKEGCFSPAVGEPAC